MGIASSFRAIVRRMHDGGDIPGPETRSFLDLTTNGIVVADLAGPDVEATYVNPAFEAMTGYPREETLGRNLRFLQGPETGQAEVAEMRQAIRERRAATVTVRNHRKDGSMFWNEISLQPLPRPGGASTHYLGVMRDVTSLRDAADRLLYAATVDRLTGALNRNGFIDRLHTLSPADRGGCVLLVKVDVVDFHVINSAFGYDAGDAVLVETAARLRRLGAPLLGRLGSNAFALAVPLARGEAPAAHLELLRGVLMLRYLLPGCAVRPIDVRVATGYVLSSASVGPEQLLRRASMALQESKKAHLHEPRHFDDTMAEAAAARMHTIGEMQTALSAREFCYLYQPKIDLATGAVRGAEALVRWRHPARGLLPPGDFLALAEETGLITDIWSDGLGDIAAFAARLNRDRATPINIAVNMSARTFEAPSIVERLARKLADAGADPSWLTVELTEGLMIESSPELLGVFRRLRELGVGLSIDDFGTGYSSLSYIDRFPVSEIKIDRSFISGMIDQPIKRFIVDAVLRIGRTIGATAVAEGVETEAEAALLRDLGCEVGQGYLFGRPMSPEELEAMLAAHP